VFASAPMAGAFTSQSSRSGPSSCGIENSVLERLSALRFSLEVCI